MNKIVEKYKGTTDLNRFLIKGGLFYLMWRVFRKWLILKGQYADFTQVMAEIYLKIAKFILNILGWDTNVSYTDRKLWITESDNAIEVVFDCLAINLFFIFAIFILAYPGRVKTKAWYIPCGFIVIFLLNAMRMAALTPIVAKWPEQMDLFHHFIFQGMIYLFIFTMWWYFTKLEETVSNKKTSN